MVLSVAVWVMANVELNPEVTASFSSAIPIEVTGLPKGVVVYGTEPGSVNVKLRAPQDSWSRLRAASFRAYVDLSGARRRPPGSGSEGRVLRPSGARA